MKSEQHSSSYEDSYLGQIRNLVGDRRIIITAARAIIQDGDGRVLFIWRRDNHLWAFPAGSQELDESILYCLKREVWEETGLKVVSATPMAIYSNLPIQTSFGDEYHLFLVQFLVDEWTGKLILETEETIDARFFALDEVPKEVAPFYWQALEDIHNYDGDLILK